MSEHSPKFRLHAADGRLALRDGLVLAFFMKHSHGDIASAVIRALEHYCDAVGREKLECYPDMEGEWQPLDEAGWEHVRQKLLSSPKSPGCNLHLVDHANAVAAYEVRYHGYNLDAAFNRGQPDLVSGLSFGLPTEELEARGPGWVRKLAVRMARELPFSSGYVSLAFQRLGVASLEQTLLELARRHPGIDFLHLSSTTRTVGTKARGAYWLNFYGMPLLEKLGRAWSLKERLRSPGMEVEELEPDQKVLVSLGEWPEAGDEEQGKDMSAYRALAGVLEPHLYEDSFRWPGFWPPDQARWMRRFLD